MRDGRDPLRIADLTHVPIEGGSVHVAAIFGARSRRVVGCAIGRCTGATPTPAASRAVPDGRRPRPGSIHDPERIAGQFGWYPAWRNQPRASLGAMVLRTARMARSSASRDLDALARRCAFSLDQACSMGFMSGE